MCERASNLILFPVRCLDSCAAEDQCIGIGVQLHSDDGVSAQLPGLILGLLDELSLLGAPRVGLLLIMIRRLPCIYHYYPMYQIVKKNI